VFLVRTADPLAWPLLQDWWRAPGEGDEEARAADPLGRDVSFPYFFFLACLYRSFLFCSKAKLLLREIFMKDRQ
jgi:hypothetical protein